MEYTCLIVNESGLIVNRIVYDDELTPPDWHPGEGLTMLDKSIDGAIGGSYINGVYTPPPEPKEDD